MTSLSYNAPMAPRGAPGPRRPSVAIQKGQGSILGAGYNNDAPLLMDEDRAKKLEALSQMIGNKLASKYKTVRQCFRFIDTENKGSIVREDVHRLFRNLHLDNSFGHTDLSYADDFFDLLNLDGNYEIDFHELQAFIGPYVNPGCPILVSSGDADGYDDHLKKSKFHPIAFKDNKDSFATTYGQSMSARAAPRPPSGLPPGYGGFVPNWTHDVLAGLEKMDLQEESLDPLPRNGRRKSCHEIRAATEPVLSSCQTPRDARSCATPSCSEINFGKTRTDPIPNQGLPPLREENMMRRLNQAAITVGNGFFSSRPRRASR